MRSLAEEIDQRAGGDAELQSLLTGASFGDRTSIEPLLFPRSCEEAAAYAA